MGSRTVSVKITAPTLSLLVHENINSDYDQEGFLLGNINTTIMKSVTDNTREEVKIKEEINITGVFPCDLPNMYYQADGELIKDKLNEVLGKEKKNVVAWFKYKKYRKYDFKFSLREKVLHEELTNFFNISPYLFTCCLLSTSHNINKSTQIFSHAFINMSEYNLKMIPMRIENLGDACHIYQPNIKPSDPFMKLYNKINKDQSDLKVGTDIHESLKNELGKSVNNLESSESKLWKLRREVNELSKKLRKSVLASNPWPSGITNNSVEVSEIEIDVPLSAEFDNLFNPVPESKEDTDLDTSTPVVDLTLSDEDDDASRKVRLRYKKKLN